MRVAKKKKEKQKRRSEKHMVLGATSFGTCDFYQKDRSRVATQPLEFLWIDLYNVLLILLQRPILLILGCGAGPGWLGLRQLPCSFAPGFDY